MEEHLIIKLYFSKGVSDARPAICYDDAGSDCSLEFLMYTAAAALVNAIS